MSAALRRGACPSLSAPMQTGDGLLARLSPADGELSAAQLAGIAAAAARHGNGLLEITARGNLQIRGLTAVNIKPLREEITALDIAVRTGVAVETGPLAGLDASEIADPRPLAEAIREGANAISGKLAPKVSVVVDGGGALPLGGIPADVRLTAEGDGWQVGIGGDGRTERHLGRFDTEKAGAAALAILAALAAAGETARARDLTDANLARVGLGVEPAPRHRETRAALPVGSFALGDGSSARGFALPFGQIGSGALAAFADAAQDARAIRLARGRGLLVIGLPARRDAALAETAAGLGFVTASDDPRLRIVACAGAPACRSARIATKTIAAALARNPLLPPQAQLHVSGCAKRCSAPAGAAATLVGTGEGCVLEGGESLDPALRAALAGLGRLHFLHRDPS